MSTAMPVCRWNTNIQAIDRIVDNTIFISRRKMKIDKLYDLQSAFDSLDDTGIYRQSKNG